MTTVKYKGATLTTVDNATKTLTTSGTYLEDDIIITDTSGAASNVVSGTFTTSSTTGAAQTITIPYTGSGYPIACMVYVTDGMYNTSNTDWYSTIQRYAIGEFTISKAVQTSAPTYTTSGTQNYGVVSCVYKSSTSSGTTYSRSGGQTANTYSSSAPTASTTLAVRFGSATSMKVFVASTSYGLMADTKYTYHIIYS